MLNTIWPSILLFSSEVSRPSIMSTLLNLMVFLLVFAVVIAFAYLTTKFIGNRGIAALGNRNIKIIEKTALGVEKSLFIINIGNKYYLIGTGKHTIELLDKLDKEDISLVSKELKENLNPQYFDSYLKQVLNKKETFVEDIDEEEITSLNTLKNKLSKMKTQNEAFNKVIDKDENDEMFI